MKKAIALVIIILSTMLLTMLLAESAGGVQWTPPKRWSKEADRPMRAATYKVPKSAGDPEDGECGVFFFGAGQGGGTQANLDRWSKQFQTPGGQPVEPKTKKETINGFAVTTVDISGTYMASAGPMMAATTAKPGYRMLAAVVEGKQANIFFKLTGPKKTVTATEAEFQALLKSIQAQ
jgi:hypothetical protein